MSSIASSRLRQERKVFRKDHPMGWFAKPHKNVDGTNNLMKWKAGITGPEGTAWEGGTYKLDLVFSSNYPSEPPKVSFTELRFHPNIYPSGKVCLSILSEEKGWKPSITVKMILQGVHDLLDDANLDDPANASAYRIAKGDPAEYMRRVKAEALRFRST